MSIESNSAFTLITRMECSIGMFGILNINKPNGWTSRDCVNQIQRVVRPVKVGHAGTLDPIANGVLLILLGQATRLVDSLHLLPKRYSSEFELGLRSDSADTESPVESLLNPRCPTLEEIQNHLPRFVGPIQQIPPIYSAIKIGGIRAYKLARAGKPVELMSRAITVHQIELTHFSYPKLHLNIECSSGTYIRSIGRDLAASLGTSAVMTALTRTAIGPFTLESATSISELKNVNCISKSIHNPSLATMHLPRVILDSQQLTRIALGQSIQIAGEIIEPLIVQQISTPIQSDPSGTAQGQPVHERAPGGKGVAALDDSGNLRALLEERPNGTWKAKYNFHV